MKITIISIYFPPERGAAPSRLMTTALELEERGYDVDVITALANYPTGKIFPKYKGRFLYKEKVNNIPCRRYWLYPSKSKNPILRLFGMLSFSLSIICALPYLLKRKPDVVFVQSPPLLVGLSGVLLGKLVGAKVITNVSDIWPLTALELKVIKKGILYNVLERVEKCMYKFSDGFIGQSQETLDHIKNIRHKPSLLYRNITPPSPYLKQEIAFKPNALKVVYAGLIGFPQGVASLCKKIDFKSLGVEFHIYGNGVEREEIQKYILNNSTCNIYLHDMIPKEAVPQMLSQYHATIIPLKKPIYGAFPSKVFMAIASGLPIFYSGGREGEALIKKLKIGWTSEPGNYKDMESNIKSFTSLNKNQYEKLRKNCIEACEHELNYEGQQNELAVYIDQICSSNSLKETYSIN